MRSAPGSWSPLVEGDAAAQALAAAAAIARDLSCDPAAATGPGLARGHAGLALFFSYFEKTSGHAEAGERAEYHLERAIGELADQPAPSASLYHGFAGVAWVTEHLAAGEVSGEEEDLNEEIDAALLSILRRSPWHGEHDLLGGLVGWGVYALERLPRPSAAAMLPLLLARLAENADAWELDPGMAHGAAGAIALLARILREGAAVPETARLLAAMVDSVLARTSRGDGTEAGDLAWCSGDAGLSAALLAAGRASGREDWESTARRLAVAASESHREDPGGFDPALCHGTAGLSHLFHRLYRATGDPALFTAAHHWLERTLAQRRPGEGIGGFLCRSRQADGRPGWVADPGFLGGAAGIGLALLAAATPVEPAWDRLLLLSGR